MYKDLAVAKTLEDIEKVSLGELKSMNNCIKSLKATNFLMKNIEEFKKYCKQSVLKKEKGGLSQKEKSVIDHNMLQNLTRKFETE